MTPVAPRCLLSCRSPLETTRLQKSWRNLPPRLTCMLRRPSSSQWESSRPAISQRFSRRVRSRVLSPLFPNVTCFLHVALSPSLSTWRPQVAPHPIISPVEFQISASCHLPRPQGMPLLLFGLASPGLRPSDDPGLSDSAIGMSLDRLSDPDELSSSADSVLPRARLDFALTRRLRLKRGFSVCPALIFSILLNNFKACKLANL